MDMVLFFANRTIATTEDQWWRKYSEDTIKNVIGNVINDFLISFLLSSL